ncbi:hypothetical protein [Synergistes jonesii]|uniref:hypothetical protein n=1 Tax=Synergistes jonesii TaxID=2754 RepID=UPI00248E5E71|nr:hypothetical protein [Synergistes jonesii]
MAGQVAPGDSEKTSRPRTIEEFLRAQGRYSHLFKKGSERLDLVEEAQRDADESWAKLLERCGR